MVQWITNQNCQTKWCDHWDRIIQFNGSHHLVREVWFLGKIIGNLGYPRGVDDDWFHVCRDIGGDQRSKSLAEQLLLVDGGCMRLHLGPKLLHK